MKILVPANRGAYAPRLLDAHLVGWIITPSNLMKARRRDLYRYTVGLDNEMYSYWANNKPFDDGRWLEALDYVRAHHYPISWAVVPDSPTDALATRHNYDQYAHLMGDLPLAYVYQDGFEWDHLPDDPRIVCFFIAGREAPRRRRGGALIREAKRRGLSVHVGRVNSREAVRRWYILGADSVDGTTYAIQPSRLRDHLVELRSLRLQMPLFE